MTSVIRKTREEHGFSMARLGRAIGRSAQWIALVETGKILLSPEIENRILQVIQRLAEFQHIIEINEREVFRDLIIPKQAGSRYIEA